MKFPTILPVTALAAAGLFALAGCSQSALNDSEIEPNFEAIGDTFASSPPSDPQPEADSSGTGGTSLTDTCMEYYEFDQEVAAEIEQVMATATSLDATEEEMAEAQQFIQDARADFEEIVAEAEHEEFLSAAEQTLPTYDVFETMTDPSLSEQEKFDLIEGADMEADMNNGMDAETELIEMCDAELNEW